MLKPLVYGLAFGLPLTKALIPSNANSYGALSLRDPLAAHSDPELGASDESDDDDMDVSDDYYEENSGEEMDLDEPEAEAEPEKPPPPLIDQAVFQQYVAKGKKLYDYMSEPNEARLTQALIKDKKKLEGGSLASRFTRYENDLTESGWKKSSRPEADFEVDVSLKPTVKGLGLSTTFRPKDPNGLNEYVSWRQNVSPFVGTDGKKHNDPKIPVTDASYTNVYNTKQGVLMMISNYGPRHELRERIEKDLDIHDPKKIKDMQESYVYPKLQHLSDVLGLEYGGQCKKNGDNPKKLDKIIGYEAQSHDAVQVMDYILKDLRAPGLKKASQYGHFQPPTWEKKLTFSAGKPEFNAILASPGGNIATFLLLQHREMFGMKRISKVDVFDDDHYDHDKDHPNFKGASKVFYLEDLDPKTGKPVDVASASQSKHKPPKTAPNKVVKPNNDKKKHPKGDKNNPRPGGSGSGSGAGPRPQRMARGTVDSSDALIPRDSLVARSDVEMTGMDVDLGSSDDEADKPVKPELTDEGYRQAVAKGKKMYQWMGVTDEKILTQQLVKDRKLGAGEPLQSKFVKYPGDLMKIGGLRNDQAKLDQRMSNWKDVPLKSAVQDLDISLTWRVKGQAGDHEYKTWRQTNPEFVGENGKPVDAEYATGATYANVYNTRQGVVYFISNYGPKHELPETLDFVADGISDQKRQQIIDNYVYPQLSHVSDIVALEYMGQAEKMGHSPKVLNKMFMFGSQSDGVVQVVDHILKKKGVSREQHPGISGYYKAPEYAQKMTFDAGSDEFYACLSTPNGGLGVFMLLQHRKQFGIKRISKIDLFNDEHELYEKTSYKGATMIFYLEDLDASGKPVAAAGASGSAIQQTPEDPKPKSGGRSGGIAKPQPGSSGSGGRSGLQSGNKGQVKAKL